MSGRPDWRVHRASMELELPFDMGLSLLCGQAFRWTPRGDGGYRGVVGRKLVDVWQDAGGTLRWESGPEPVPEEELVRYFRLDDDLEGIRNEISDPRVDAAFARYTGLRLLRQDPWETLISFVISQLSNVPRISRTVEALSLHFGSNLGDGIHNAFPSPEELAMADEGALRLLGLGYRAPHVQRISSIFADGELFIDPLRFMGYDEARTELMSLPGVGPKVADCTLLFSLDHLEAFPVDRWVTRAVEEWYMPGESMSQGAIARWARERFGTNAGYAGQYLFHARRAGGAECPAPGVGDDAGTD